MSERELLADFIGEEVSVVTDTIMSMLTPDGEVTDVPYIAEGYLVDYDDDYVLLSASQYGPTELVAKSRIVSVKAADKLEALMKDPSKPPVDEMN